jgi:hypothetical protein
MLPATQVAAGPNAYFGPIRGSKVISTSIFGIALKSTFAVVDDITASLLNKIAQRRCKFFFLPTPKPCVLARTDQRSTARRFDAPKSSSGYSKPPLSSPPFYARLFDMLKPRLKSVSYSQAKKAAGANSL